MRSNAEIGLCFKMPLQLVQAQMGPAALQYLYVFVFVRFIDNLHKVLMTSADPSNSFKQLQTASKSFKLRTLLRSSFIYHQHRGQVGLVRADSAKLKTG